MRILVVEDSTRMAQVFKRGLAEECYAVDVDGDGISGLHLAQCGIYDLILIDPNLRSMDGITLIRKLRESGSNVPVIILSAKDRVEDRIEGLDSGADDYLVKPFVFAELLARIRALLRRSGARAEPTLKFEDIQLSNGRATRNGVNLTLSGREYSLLRLFMTNPRRVLSRTRIYESVWENQYDGISNVADVYVSYLRSKLESNGQSRVIHSVRGCGYILGEEV